MKPCLTCGEPRAASYCEEHEPATWQHRKGTARQRGYDTAWDRLSRRARKLQPFCSDCGTTEDLTTDHLPSAWQRKAHGKSIRLQDVDVVCAPCNLARGSSRQGRRPIDGDSGPRAKAQAPSLSGFGVSLIASDEGPATPMEPPHVAVAPRANNETNGAALVEDQRPVPGDLQSIGFNHAVVYGRETQMPRNVLLTNDAPLCHDRSLP